MPGTLTVYVVKRDISQADAQAKFNALKSALSSVEGLQINGTYTEKVEGE